MTHIRCNNVFSQDKPAIWLEKTDIQLNGRDARWQLLVCKQEANAVVRDVSREATYETNPADIVSIDSTGLVTPLSNGTTSVTVRMGEAVAAPFEIRVVGFDDNQSVNFPNQVIPIFTKFGCNGGGCHGKLAGQNGFKLSLLGFEPREDYEHLMKESRGRRLFPAAPDKSLLLEKSVNASPHGGGQRMDVDSYEYRLLRRWISQSMPYGSDNDPKVTSIQVIPSRRVMTRQAHQQLSVIAHYSDGSVEDITRTVQYESNSPDMADVTPQGLVRLHNMAGEVSVMARYQGHIDVFRCSIPLGGSLDNWPSPNGPVDNAVFAKLKSLGIPPSPVCDDSTFLRRSTLDITGRLPRIDEVNTFLADNRPDKRSQWIDRLLDSSEYADFFANKWNAILRNRRSGAETQFGVYAFHDWIRQSLYDNKPFDLFVKELLTASGSPEINPAVTWFREVNNTESRVEDAAQLFLGQRLQCARCHHHPYEKWSQQDYYQMAAFFSLVERREGKLQQEPRFISRIGKASATNPKNGKSVVAAGLDSPGSEIPTTTDPRIAMADWMTSANNPFFAKSVANRYWKHFLGKGLVEPEDDLRISNPPSNPELLDALSNELIQSNFDLKHLIRSICNSTTYQLASDANSDNINDPNCYSRYYPKRLTAEVLLDSLDDVCKTQTRFDGMPAGTRAVALPDTAFNSYFLTVFGRPDSTTACECERTASANLAQSLHLLNSKEMQTKIGDASGRAARFASATSVEATANFAANITELYLCALSRNPTSEEIQTAIAYLQQRPDKIREGYEDLIWSIVNSKEFLFNH